MSAQSASDANPFSDLGEIPAMGAAPSPPRGPVPPRPPRTRVHDGSRTCFESRVAFGAADADDPTDDVPTETRRFSVLETTSGLPDDSREEDERGAERHLRDMRGQVKRARAVVATTPGLAETLARDWRRAARFYARFELTEAMFRHGVPADSAGAGEDTWDQVRVPRDALSEARARAEATFVA